MSIPRDPMMDDWANGERIDAERAATTNPQPAAQDEQQWRLKPEERGHIRTTIQLLVRGEWEDAYEGADASTTALMVRTLNGLGQALRDKTAAAEKWKALAVRAFSALRTGSGDWIEMHRDFDSLVNEEGVSNG